MDLGIGTLCDDFESLASDNKSKKPAAQPFNLKWCSHKWFEDGEKHRDEDDMKFYADYLFYKKDYEKALARYHDLLNSPKFGSTRNLVAELYESIAICLRQLGQVQQALDYTQKLVPVSKNADHKTANLYLKYKLLRESATVFDATFCLKHLLLLHPFNHILWFDLSQLLEDCHQKLLTLLRTRLLLSVNAHMVTSFVKEKHSSLTNEVDCCIEKLTENFSEDTIANMNKIVKMEDSISRNDDSWMREEYRVSILGKTHEEAADVFNSKWFSMTS